MATDNPPRRRRRSGQITITEVAARAGVARITVSRALNRPDTVSGNLRARIERAVDELGYLPNRLAGSLASATTPVVPLIVPSLSNAVFLEVIRGVQTVLEENGYQMLLGNTDYDLDREAALVQTLLGWSPAGAIIAGLRHRERTVRLLRRWGRPVVELMEYGEPSVDLNVGLSHYAAGAAMARHFLDRGYRRPGFVGTRLERDYRAAQRLEGFRGALAEAGADCAFVHVHERPSTIGLGSRALRALCRDHPNADAAFFANDDLAVGALLEAQRAGVGVPDALAIAGFNGLPLGNHVTPRLTTIVSPRYRMGRRAAAMLLARLNGEPLASRSVDIGFRLVVREST